MKAAVLVFPGSNCDSDCFYVLNEVMGIPTQYIWHKDKNFPRVDLIILPGGFSYGDYIRAGVIAKALAPTMEALNRHIKEGRLVIGICNGFQILLEAGFLPGAMLRNRSLSFICKHIFLRTETTNSPFTRDCADQQILNLPIAHGEGNYFCDTDTLKLLQDGDRIAFRYSSEEGKLGDEFNPNGSVNHIAGILNEKRNVLGMMPHPERSSEAILSSEDGRKIWESLLG